MKNKINLCLNGGFQDKISCSNIFFVLIISNCLQSSFKVLTVGLEIHSNNAHN